MQTHDLNLDTRQVAVVACNVMQTGNTTAMILQTTLLAATAN